MSMEYSCGCRVRDIEEERGKARAHAQVADVGGHVSVAKHCTCSDDSSAVMTVTSSRMMIPVNHSRASMSVLAGEDLPTTWQVRGRGGGDCINELQRGDGVHRTELSVWY